MVRAAHHRQPPCTAMVHHLAARLHAEQRSRQAEAARGACQQRSSRRARFWDRRQHCCCCLSTALQQTCVRGVLAAVLGSVPCNEALPWERLQCPARLQAVLLRPSSGQGVRRPGVARRPGASLAARQWQTLLHF